MLVIRMQRTGRKGHAQFRIVVQDSRRTPTSGKVVARLGSFDPHSKQTTLDKEKAQFYLEHGAQPSPRVVRLLQSEKVKLPVWVEASDKKTKSIKNLEKLRRNRSAEPEALAEAASAEPATEAEADSTSSEPEVAPETSTTESSEAEPSESQEETASEASEPTETSKDEAEDASESSDQAETASDAPVEPSAETEEPKSE